MTSTIFALSTAPGRSGVAVVRISGPKAVRTLETLCPGKSLPKTRMASVRQITDPDEQTVIDEALVLLFKGPASFTGEDLLELQVHGGRAIVSKLLQVLNDACGLQPAEPGAFTRRAFENGRLDLTEVEGLADLISADTEKQRQQALRQMQGGLGTKVLDWSHRLTRASALYEATIDFSDEEIPDDLEQQVREEVDQLKSEIEGALERAPVAERLREGIEIAILGAPNAGKSSLLNALAQRDAAIVSDLAGTTRDVVEVQLDLNGYPVVLADTAGLRDLSLDELDVVEAEGIRRSLKRSEEADFKIVLFDASDLPKFDPASLALVDDMSLVVLSRVDMLTGSPEDLQAVLPDAVSVLSLSTRSGEGLTAFLDVLGARVEACYVQALETASFTRLRHQQKLRNCLDALEQAAFAPDIASRAEDYRLALRALGELIGRVDVEDLLDHVFSEFCIGK